MLEYVVDSYTPKRQGGSGLTYDPTVTACRAQALARLGRFEEARRDVETVWLECANTGQLSSSIWLAYARGVTELLDPETDDDIAEHKLKLALTDFRLIGSRLIELRAATSLASLNVNSGQLRDWARYGRHTGGRTRYRRRRLRNAP